MNAQLPTAKELEKLPIRAVVAYAVRNARRFVFELRGVVADNILDNAMRLLWAVPTASAVSDLRSSAIISAAHDVVEALASAPDDKRSLENLRAAFSLTQAALTAMNFLDAAADPRNAQYFRTRTANAAERAARCAETLKNRDVIADIEAARRDYEILLKEYGEQMDVEIGEPVDMSDEWWRKKSTEI